MKGLIFTIAIFMSAGLYAQTSTGGTSGVRVGGTNTGKQFNPEVSLNSSSMEVEVAMDEEAIAGFEIYNETGTLVAATSITPTQSLNASINGLPAGIYTVYVISESGETRVSTINKQ